MLLLSAILFCLAAGIGIFTLCASVKSLYKAFRAWLLVRRKRRGDPVQRKCRECGAVAVNDIRWTTDALGTQYATLCGDCVDRYWKIQGPLATIGKLSYTINPVGYFDKERHDL